eukprot:1152030-Pelagomonas_calceolata.AAC.18
MFVLAVHARALPTQVWARQHGLSAAQTADGLDGHMLAMLMVHLAERGKLAAPCLVAEVPQSVLAAWSIGPVILKI